MDFLPKDYEYHVCRYQAMSPRDRYDNECFTATLRMSLQSKEDIQVWLESMAITWRVRRTRPTKGQKTVFYNEYRCQHHTRNPQKSHRVSKNTLCGAKLKVSLVRTVDSTGRKSRSTDPHIPAYPNIVEISNIHNHNIYNAAALRFRDVGPAAVEKLTKLFEAGHSPSSALDVLKYDLLVEYGDDYVYKSADRSICPDLGYCTRLYAGIFQAEYGSTGGQGMLEALERQVQLFNTECSSECAKVCQTEDGQYLVAICSPLMTRVHAGIKNSGEVVFMDASGNMDRQHCRVLLLLTHSCAGGLPLGIIITQSEESQAISQGLDTLKSLLPEDAFSGRGMDGPQIFITDDSRAERSAIQRAFPQATLLLCIFHVLQAVWRWLWKREHGIAMTDRKPLLGIVKQIMYAKVENEAQGFYEQAMKSAVVVRYTKFRDYLENLYGRKDEWALYKRAAIPVRGNNTNNIAEAAMRILKDKILHRTKAYNVPQLFDFLSSRLNAYYEERIIDAALGRWERFQKSRFLVKCSDVRPEHISQIDKSTFEVQSSSTPGLVYTVDVDLEMCSCPVCSAGAPCKHQAGVFKPFPTDSNTYLPVTSKMKARLLQIATGKVHIEESFLAPLQSPQQSIDSSDGSQPHISEQLSESFFASLQCPQHSMDSYSGSQPHISPELCEQRSGMDNEASEDLQTSAATADQPLSRPSMAATEGIFSDEESAFDDEWFRSKMSNFTETVLNNKEALGSGVKAMVKTMDKMVGHPLKLLAPAMLLSAMHTFGRSGTNSVASKYAKALLRVANRAGPSIAAQPSSICRRKVKLGGKRQLAAGRPKKSNLTTDQRYSYAKGVKPALREHLHCSGEVLINQPKQTFCSLSYSFESYAVTGGTQNAHRKCTKYVTLLHFACYYSVNDLLFSAQQKKVNLVIIEKYSFLSPQSF